MTLAQVLSEVSTQIPEIDANRKYWFVRTQSGDYYEEFIKYGFVAVGYNEVSLQDINTAMKSGDKSKDILAERVKNIYGDEENRPGLVASQLLRFTYEICKGDIVIIPSSNSSNLTFGIVKEDMVTISNPPKLDNVCPYKKRKKVKWLKTKNRYTMDSKLLSLIYTHQTISDANEYASFIDRELNTLYKKGGKVNLVLNVQTERRIEAADWANFWSLLPLAESILKDEAIDDDTSGIETKINVQSPGVIELTGTQITTIILVGTIVLGLAGGGGNFSLKVKGHGLDSGLKTDGIIEKIVKLMNATAVNKNLTKMVDKACKSLNIKAPDDLVKIIEKLTGGGKK